MNRVLMVVGVSLAMGCTARQTVGDARGKRTVSADRRVSAGEGRPMLSTTPQGLLAPEGARLIQRALSQLDYLPESHATGELDRATVQALRKFQADRSLAKTGFPDRETVRKLGLKPKEVFRPLSTEAIRRDGEACLGVC